MPKEKVKIRVAELEEHELFKYKGGIFKVVWVFEEDTKALVIKPRRIKNQKYSPIHPTPTGQHTTFHHDVMVQRYNKKPKKETKH